MPISVSTLKSSTQDEKTQDGIYSWSLIKVWCGILLVSHPSHYCAILLSNDIFISELADLIKMQKNAEELRIAVSALKAGQLSHGCSWSHNTWMQRQHICTNPWEPVLKYTYSLTYSMTETCKPEHKFQKGIQKKDSDVCLECLGLTSNKNMNLFNTIIRHCTGFQICSNQTQPSGHRLWTPHNLE